MNDKQRRFVQEYLIDLNATQAAIRAGYSKKTAYSQGHDLLKKPEIQNAVTGGMAELAARAKITKSWLIEKSRNVFELALGLNTDALDRYGKPTGEQRRQLSAANKALENISKLTGHWVERQDVTVRTLDQMTRAELEAELAVTRDKLSTATN